MKDQTQRLVLAFADLVMDQSAHVVTRGTREVALTPIEWRLLEMFLRHPRQVLTHRQLLAAGWGLDVPTGTNTVSVAVFGLRRKLAVAGESQLVATVRGVGYVLREPLAGAA